MPGDILRSEQLPGFFWLREPQGRAYAHSGLQDWKVGQLRRFALGLEIPDKPFVINWGAGRKIPSDVIWLVVSCCAVSPRFLEVLSNFTGWTTFPLEVFDGHGQPVPGYAGLAITGHCGEMRNNLRRVETDERWGGRDYVGLEFDLETWDGTDIFSPSQGAGPIITGGLRDALRKAKITNYQAVPLPDVRMHKQMVDDYLARSETNQSNEHSHRKERVRFRP